MRLNVAGLPWLLTEVRHIGHPFVRRGPQDRLPIGRQRQEGTPGKGTGMETKDKSKATIAVKKVRGLMAIKTRIRAGIHCTTCL